MSKYIVETYYTCAFKILHELNELNEKELNNLEKRSDGKVEIIEVVLNNRKTKPANGKNKNYFDKKPANEEEIKITAALNQNIDNLTKKQSEKNQISTRI